MCRKQDWKAVADPPEAATSGSAARRNGRSSNNCSQAARTESQRCSVFGETSGCWQCDTKTQLWNTLIKQSSFACKTQTSNSSSLCRPIYQRVNSNVISISGLESNPLLRETRARSAVLTKRRARFPPFSQFLPGPSCP